MQFDDVPSVLGASGIVDEPGQIVLHLPMFRLSNTFPPLCTHLEVLTKVALHRNDLSAALRKQSKML